MRFNRQKGKEINKTLEVAQNVPVTIQSYLMIK